MIELSSLSKDELMKLVQLALSRRALLLSDIVQCKKQSLYAACSLFGSLRAFSRQFGFDAANVNRWLLGHPTLSQSRVAAMLEALGLPEMTPRRDIIHRWTPSHRCDLELALKLYFPGKVFAATLHQQPQKRTLYALHDGQVCALMQLPYGCELPRVFRPHTIHAPSLAFFAQGLSVQAFKAAWAEDAHPDMPSLEDILDALQDGEDISQAVQRLWGEKP